VVLAVLESPLAYHVLTGVLDAQVCISRQLLGVVSRAVAKPRDPARFALNVLDGTFECTAPTPD
jgi:hypothetical protein